MKPIPLMYAVRSESGQHNGYILPIELAKHMPNHKPPPDEREWGADRFVTLTPPNTSPIIKTRLRGV